MANLLTLTPVEFKHVSECSLQHHFWQQITSIEDDVLDYVVLETIQHLHAMGGPHRLNLPSILRYMEQIIPINIEDDINLTALARQIVANYHRYLRKEWAKIIASNEQLILNIKLKKTIVCCETVVDRLDQEEDGGITVIKFLTEVPSMPEAIPEDDIEVTMLHALAAAAYPHKRPVRVKYLWLVDNQTQTIELSEKTYRHNLERMKERVQKWVDGEILARPGLYCDQCPFKEEDCPIYANDYSTTTLQDLPEDDSSATLSSRKWIFMEDDNFEESNIDP